MKAAVMRQTNQPLVIEDVDIDIPREHEVLVRVAATGVCHSDLHILSGRFPLPPPAILGHEVAGIVELAGPGVTYVKPGDRVIACPSLFCGVCRNCITGRPALCNNRPTRAKDAPPRLTQKGKTVEAYARIGSFAEYILLHENALAKIGNDIPLDRAALVGCAVTTGVGAVLNTARIEAGSAVAVFGAGGVGLSAIQGARIGGASLIIAVDIAANKLKMAADLGATHTVDSSSQDPVKAIREITGEGVDYSFEAIGLKRTAEQAFESLRPGGTATLIGVMAVGEKIEVGALALLQERKIQGSQMGSNRFRVDMPRYLEFYRQGRLRLDEMITRRGRLKDVNQAFEAMKAGEVARTVLTFD